jgi:hypothetical protein
VLAWLCASGLLGFGNTEAVSTKDQTLSAELHGEALLRKDGAHEAFPEPAGPRRAWLT